MSWLVIGAALVAAWVLLRGKVPTVGGGPVVKPIDPTDYMGAIENSIQSGAKKKEHEILQEIQARLNIQARLDMLSRANEHANGGRPPAPKS